MERNVKNDLYRMLSPVAAKWNRFGLQLNLRQSELNKLKPRNRASQDCFQDMMEYWTDNGSYQWKPSAIVQTEKNN